MENWVFEIGDVIKVDTVSVEGTSENDTFQVIDRDFDDDCNEFYTIERTSDQAVWEGVPLCAIL